MFVLESVTKTYTSHRGTVHALRDASLTIKRESFVTVTGPSGSGKTTLLLTLGGLIRPTSGRIMFHGDDLANFEKRLPIEDKEKLGFILDLLTEVISSREEFGVGTLIEILINESG